MTSLKYLYRKNLVLTVFLPFILLIIFVSTFSFQFFKQEKLTNNLETNLIVSSTIKEKIHHISVFLKKTQNIMNTDFSFTNNTLKNIVLHSSYISQALLINKNGIVKMVIPYNSHIIGYDVSQYDYFKKVSQNNQINWSFSLMNPYQNKASASVSLKLQNDQVLTVYLDLDWLIAGFKALAVILKNQVAIIDQQGTYIGHTNQEYVKKRSVEPHFNQFMQDIKNKQFQSIKKYQGKNYVCNISSIPEIGWNIITYQPEEAINNPLQTFLYYILLITSLIFIYASILFSLNRKSIVNSLSALVEGTKQITDGNYKTQLGNSKIKEFDTLSKRFNYMGQAIQQDINAKLTAEKKAKKALKEKEILLQELYHRTKNNMQIISSIIRLKALNIKSQDINILLNEIDYKIQTMSMVHHKLYESNDLSHISLRDYIRDLTNLFLNFMHIHDFELQYILKLDEVQLIIDTALPLGMVLSELITNSLKHAFPQQEKGIIKIVCKKLDDDTLDLEYSDNGIGLPKDFDLETQSAFGLYTLSEIIQEQMAGKLELSGSKGFYARITFNKNLYEPRI